MSRSSACAREPEPRAEVIDPKVYIPALLSTLSNNLTRNASTFYRRNFGVGLTDWRIMYRLAAEPWISAHRICVASQIDKGVVSRSLGWLEKQGLILVQDDETDARRRLLALSPVGIELHDRITVVALERERNFLAHLTQQEAADAIRLLQKMALNLRAFGKPVAIPPPGPLADAASRRPGASTAQVEASAEAKADAPAQTAVRGPRRVGAL